MKESQLFDATQIDAELSAARRSGRAMLQDALSSLKGGGDLYEDDLPFLGFIERAQAFHIGTVNLVEQGNPLAAVTLLRAYAENLAVVFWVNKRPGELDKLRPGAKQGLPIGKVVAAAEKGLPGFKALYDHWSGIAHPSGGGAFHTLQVADDGQFSWQSHPNFKSTEDARQVLEWLDDICSLTTTVIKETTESRRRFLEERQ